MAPSASKLKLAGIAVSASILLVLIKKKLQNRTNGRNNNKINAKQQQQQQQQQRPFNKSRRVAVDRVFFKNLWALLKVIYPGPFTPEVGFTVLVAVMMLLRTYCDLWMIKNTTMMERIIISRDAKEFPRGLFKFILAMFPIACVNNLLKYGLAEMVLCFRTRLTAHVYQEYLKGFTYYKINNLDTRISNPDQLLTQDLEKFCQSISDFYSNVSKPLLDMVIYATKLTGAIGIQGPGSMLLYLALSGLVLTTLRKPLGRFTVVEQQLEGDFRFVNSRLITNSEEVAFYQGNQREKLVIEDRFTRLVKHLRKSMHFRFSMGIIDHIIAKYFATVVGFLVVSRPFLNLSYPAYLNATNTEIMEHYYKAGRMLVNLATAVGRLVLAGRELTRLAGFTSRMTELIEVLKDLNSGIYIRTMVTDTKDGTNSAINSSGSENFAPNAGKIIEVDHLIRFDKVPIVTPNGDILVNSLTFQVESGMNVLVCGPNGCGKSSLFRIVGELWPIWGGTVYKPAKEKLFYIPQRPYMTLGTLRDQVIYPHTMETMKSKGVTDNDLHTFLDQVKLTHLVEREGWDAVQDWMDVLSGGEKQRVAMARLFYHRPQFAILDECTSAVSVDVEGFMYKQCRSLGITLFTVSHRKSLWEHHEYVLSFDGRGAYQFAKISEVHQFGS